MSSLAGRYICFRLDNEKFAIPLLQVREVVALNTVTPIPKMPAYFKGITNLRGQIISIIDLKAKMSASPKNLNHGKTVIIFDLELSGIGIIVDSVDSVVTYDEKNLDNFKQHETMVQTDFILGIAKEDQSITILLDLKSALGKYNSKIRAEDLRRAA